MDPYCICNFKQNIYHLVNDTERPLELLFFDQNKWEGTTPTYVVPSGGDITLDATGSPYIEISDNGIPRMCWLSKTGTYLMSKILDGDCSPLGSVPIKRPVQYQY